jgi:hypothetical protein
MKNLIKLQEEHIHNHYLNATHYSSTNSRLKRNVNKPIQKQQYSIHRDILIGKRPSIED